jgi:hypothetical protein
MNFNTIKLVNILFPNNKALGYPKLLFALVIFILILCITSTQNEIIDYTSEQIQFNNQKNSSPTKLISQKKSALLLSANITFIFTNKDPSFSYGNLLQTSSNSDVFRLELQPQNKLVLIAGEGRLFPISENLKSNHSYNVNFNYSRQNYIQVTLDGRKVLDIQDPEITNLKFYLQNFVIGSGYSLTRPFNGEINNFQAIVQYSQLTTIAKLSNWIIPPISFITFFFLYLKLLRPRIPSFSDIPIISNGQIRANDIYLFPLTIILSGIFIWIAVLLGEQNIGFAKWLPYLLIPLPLLLLGLNRYSIFKGTPSNQLLILLPLIIITGLLLISISRANEFNRYLLLFSTLSTSIALISLNQYPLVTIFVSLISWITIYPLLNWKLISGLLEESPFPYLIFACITLVLIGLFIYRQAIISIKNYLLLKWALPSIALLTFFYLSFRTDALFIPGSEFHWEYFVGPIRTIRNGGWLLYDAPSQYGFLNILIANLLPFPSSWQSFYIFQSSVLFLTSSTVLFLLFSIGQPGISSRFLIFLLIMGSFFFADPAWIGPTPYPSSSVTRFFCCYLLLCLSFIPKHNKYRTLLVSFGWLIGILWSAESSLYSTVIYFFYITADLINGKSWETRKHILFKYFIYSFSLLIGALGIIAAYYQIKLGHPPNFLSHFDYALGYASGYGYVPFPLNGPGNFMLMIFLGLGLLTLISSRSHENATITASLACATGCVWSIGSYYLGRPVPQNITAIFPLLTTCVLIGLLQARRISPNLPFGPLSAAAFPLFFLVLSTFYTSSFWRKSITFQSFSENISTKLLHKSDELTKTLEKIDPKGIMPRVYLGDGAVSPKSNNDLSEKTWLPTPLQLIMPPISQKRKEQILNRFICSSPHNQVVLIHQPGSVSSELPNINSLITNYFDLVSTNKIRAYEVLLYVKKSDAPCN